MGLERTKFAAVAAGGWEIRCSSKEGAECNLRGKNAYNCILVLQFSLICGIYLQVYTNHA